MPFIPRLFLKSCEWRDAYPSWLVERPRYGLPLLQSYQGRFSTRQKELNLFVPEAKLFVPHWDILDTGDVDQKILHTEKELSDYLGDNFQLGPQDTGGGPIADVVSVKPDPKARWIFLTTASSVAPLEITPDGLKRVLSYYQVMPSFLDFLYTFGPKNGDERESTRFSGFRTEKTFRDIKPASQIKALKRSGKRYQVCYTLKSIALKSVDPQAPIDKTWRVRSAVVYHQFDIEYGTQLWIIGDPLQGIQDLVQEHVHEGKNHIGRYGTVLQSFRSSLEMILRYAQGATEEWRWHVQSSEEIVDKLTQHYVAIRHQSPKSPIRWSKHGLLIIQEREGHLVDTKTCLESNLAIFRRLSQFYTNLVKEPLDQWSKKDIAEARRIVREFVSDLDEYIYDVEMQLKRATLALQVAKERKDILIQHLTAQNAERQEAYTDIMWKQQHKTGLDAVVMKVITVVTLIFLPMTFVSTFFSTDVVKYQLDDPSPVSPSAAANEQQSPQQQNQEPALQKYSPLALARFFQVSVPLMFFTFLGAFLLYRQEKKRMIAKNEKDMERVGHIHKD